MNGWKIAFGCCLALLLAVGATAGYVILDQGVTLTHQREGYVATERDLDCLLELFNNGVRTRGRLEESLRDHRLRRWMDFGRDTITLERVVLILDRDTLRRIDKQW